MGEREENELRAITLHTRHCSIPLVEESENTAEILGTGSPFTVNSQHYLITAAHILEDLIANNQMERVGIRLRETSAAVANLGRCYIETFRTSGPFDAAVIRLEQPELIAALLRGWRFLSPNDLSPIRSDTTNCFVAGYPRATTRRTGWELSAKFHCFVTSLFDEAPQDADDVREGLDIFLRHRNIGEELHLGSVAIPNLKGLSGASIWGMIHTTGDWVWSAESKLRIMGIQTHCRSGSYIRGKSWKLVGQIFKRFDRRAFEEIEAVLNE
jgi:Trypsin